MKQEGIHSGISSPLNEPDSSNSEFPEWFQPLLKWAKQYSLDQSLTVAYHALGLNKQTVAIANLVTELSYPEAKLILKEWQDNPIVSSFTLLIKELSAWDEFQLRHAPITHKGNASGTKRLYEDLRNRSFLLAMITNPLSEVNSQELFQSRRRLRLWLIIQASKRVVEHQYSADSNISEAARFLIIGPHDPHWSVIDALLTRANYLLGNQSNTHERFNVALEASASQLSFNFSGNKGEKKFLNAIVAITQGQCKPIEKTGRILPALQSYSTLSFSQPPILTDEETQHSYQLFPTVAVDDLDDEQDESTCVVSVDPTDSYAQQKLTTRSVFIQSAEASHYLTWSWDKLLPPEITALKTWYDQELLSSDTKTSFGAALVWISCHFARSLEFTLRIQIDDDWNPEWRISSDFKEIRRLAPRRVNAWKPNNHCLPFIKRYSNDFVIQLPQTISTVLRRTANLAQHQTENSALGSLWHNLSSEPIETWFNQQVKKVSPRVTSAKLAYVMPQKVFDHLADHNLARVISAHPNSGLPGACGYSSWDIATIEKSLPLTLNKEANQTPSTHLLGSLLTPTDGSLNKTIVAAYTTLINSTQNTLTFHNNLAQYCVMALYAATGSRFLKDPFESPTYFSDIIPTVFINDKSDEGLHNGRLVPLPDKAIQLLNYYCEHLHNLADQVINLRPELAQKLNRLAKKKSTELPLFFLLDEHLHWRSMTGLEGANTISLFDWPLPANLFRHRFAQRLAEQQVDPEIIDGWMGHAERHVASYGDTSPRCWLDDVNAHKDAINHIFDQLEFSLPSFDVELAPLHNAQFSKDKGYQEPLVFGEKARARERRKTLKAATTSARQDITLFLGSRQPDELDAEATDMLITRMLLRENKLPHPQAAIRVRVLNNLLERSGSEHKHRIRKRAASIQQSNTILTHKSISACSVFPTLKTWASQTRRTILKAQLSKADALWIGAFLFAIEKQISYVKLLTNLVQGVNFRLLQHKKQYYLEYSEALIPDDYQQPVQRHEISYKTASLLHYGMGIHKDIDPKNASCPSLIDSLPIELLEPFGSTTSPKPYTLLEHLCQIIEQYNLVTLPGMVAAGLSERIPPTSLNFSDYLNLTEKRQWELQVSVAFIEKPRPSFNEAVNINGGREIETDKEALQHNAKILFREITQLLSQYRKPAAKTTAKEIEQLCKLHSGRVSHSILMLGYWISDVARRGKGHSHNRHISLAQNTLTTYFSSLTLAFQGLAYNINLLSLDSDDITELYSEMLECKRLNTNQLGYFGDRLQAFHRWARSMGADDPDWSELNLEDVHRKVRPGILSETQYLQAQALIRKQFSQLPDRALHLGFTLMLAYRFGLRSKEAIGLSRKDWCEQADMRWVLIRNNRQRSLKSFSSRRAVPLLFPLDPQEGKLIEQTLGQYQSLAGKDDRYPLLCQLHNGDVTLTHFVPLIPETLIKVLRQVTENKSIVLHHCRHSFYNRVAPLLCCFQAPLADALTNDLHAEKIRPTVLGPQNHCSRRSSMALARLMGHHTVRTGLVNYNHLITDWADQLTPVDSIRGRVLSGALQTKGLKKTKATSSKKDKGTSIIQLEFSPPTVSRVLKTLRLVSIGRTYERAATLNELSPEHGIIIERVLTEAAARMRFKIRGDNEGWVNGADYPLALLHYINDAAWRRMLSAADSETEVVLQVNAPYPSLEELPYLLGKNRHLLMSHDAHCRLVKHTLDSFCIPATQIKVAARDNNALSTELMQHYGFHVLAEESAAPNKSFLQLDPFNIRVDGLLDYRRDYGGLVIQRSQDGVIRNSYELTVAFISTGVAKALALKNDLTN